MNELLSGTRLSAISKSVGGDETAVKSALAMSVPLVLGTMANHMPQQPAGTEMLTKTLAQEVVGWRVDEYLFPLSKTGANYRLCFKKREWLRRLRYGPSPLLSQMFFEEFPKEKQDI